MPYFAKRFGDIKTHPTNFESKTWAALLLETGTSVVTDWGNHYKLGQLLLQNREVITN